MIKDHRRDFIYNIGLFYISSYLWWHVWWYVHSALVIIFGNYITIHIFQLIFITPGLYYPEKVNLDKDPQYSLTGKGRVEKLDNILDIQISIIY